MYNLLRVTRSKIIWPLPIGTVIIYNDGIKSEEFIINSEPFLTENILAVHTNRFDVRLCVFRLETGERLIDLFPEKFKGTSCY